MANEVVKSSLGSSNMWTNIGTIIVAIILSFLTPDLPTAAQLGAEIQGVIAAIKAANYGLIITAVFNLGNILYHIFKKK
jgi:hypothetical protein